MTAADILSHCEAVVKGEIPQHPKLLEVIPQVHGLGYGFKWGGYCLNVVANTQTSAEKCALIALLLGLDKPAPEILLKWLPDVDGEVVAFNEYLNAATWHFQERTKARIYLRNIVLMELDFRGDDRKEKATAWCETMLRAIITQTPKQ